MYTTASTSSTIWIDGNCIDCSTGRDEGACLNPEHEHAGIFCMWHLFTHDEHTVGEMCLEEGCGKQWFYSPDWSTPECRTMRDKERESRLFRWLMNIERLLGGWKWRGVWEYRP